MWNIISLYIYFSICCFCIWFLLNEINILFCNCKINIIIYITVTVVFGILLCWENWTFQSEEKVSFLHPLCDNWLKGKGEQSNWPLFKNSAFMEAWIIYSHRILTASSTFSPPLSWGHAPVEEKHQSLPIQVSDTLLQCSTWFSCVMSDYNIYRDMTFFEDYPYNSPSQHKIYPRFHRQDLSPRLKRMFELF